MQNRHQSRATAKAKSDRSRQMRMWLGSTAILLGGALWAGQAFADSHVEIIETHAFNEYAEPKYPADFENLDYVNVDAPVGGEISISRTGTFDSMAPYATQSGTPGLLSSVMWETVMTATSDEIGSSYCLLCTTIEYPEDRKWMIVNMRDGIFFTNGEPLTVEDVVFSINLLGEQGTPSAQAFIGQLIEDMEILDDKSFKVTFRDDYPFRGRIGQIGSFPVFSKKWFDETGARLDEASLEASPGSGEYMTASIDPGRQIIYERNPDYWGAELPINRGRGNFDSIRIEYFADSSAAFEGFKAGEFTFRRETSSINWATSYDFPAIENGSVVRDTLDDGTMPLSSGFVFNMRDPKFADKRIRQAIGLMYNFTWTNENLQYGLFQQRESFWQTDRLKATGVPEGEELAVLEALGDKIDPAILTEEVAMPHTSGDRPLDRGNLRKALSLMEEAGWTIADDGLLRNADGQSLDIEFLETRQAFDRIINPYIENLTRLGVNITYNRVDPSQFQSRRQDSDWEMMYWYYNNSIVEGTGFSQRFGCEDRDDVFNITGYCSEAVDELGDLIADAETYDEMATYVSAADRIMRHEYFMIPAWFQNKNWVAYFDMYEYPENLPEFGLGHLDYWWFNEEKYEALKASGALR